MVGEKLVRSVQIVTIYLKSTETRCEHEVLKNYLANKNELLITDVTILELGFYCVKLI